MFQHAQLAEHYHYTAEQIGNLIERQIHQVYFHKRDKQGGLVVPPAVVDKKETRKRLHKPATLEEELKSVEGLRNVVGNFEDLIAQIKEKWGHGSTTAQESPE